VRAGGIELAVLDIRIDSGLTPSRHPRNSNPATAFTGPVFLLLHP